MRFAHAMRFGATLMDGGTRFRLWAPAARRVELLLQFNERGRAIAARALPDGWHEVQADNIGAGQRYRWRIDGETAVPDPASRSNPEGPQGPSVVVDPRALEWDSAWYGRPWHETVFYQLHIGTFTREGSFDAATNWLPELADLGITAIQLMPLADFPGGFGWGYDGVLPFAPYHRYGSPLALKRFVQTAHELGLMVFGDVVYNHFGPEGNYLHTYAPQFFSSRHRTAWGPAINFDGTDSNTVRQFFIDNALYWLNEYRFDGLRLDAVHAMLDDRNPDILTQLSRRVRDETAGRHVHLVLENDANDERRLGGPGARGLYDGQWNGDVHHSLHVLLTGEHDGYYSEYAQPVVQLARCLTHGYARQGGPHNVEGAEPRRAAEGSAPLGAMVNFLQNHDQIGNRAFGERLSTLAEAAPLRLATAIVLLAPCPPMLFMGEEWDAQEPFQYFAGWHGELAEAVRQGRASEFAHFPAYAQAARQGRLPDPCSGETPARCVLNRPLQVAQARAFHAELLRCRQRHITPVLPHLASEGHESSTASGLLQVRWRFNAHAQQGPRALVMQVNLSARPVEAPETPADFTPVFNLHGAGGGEFGPWSGRWLWQDGSP